MDPPHTSHSMIDQDGDITATVLRERAQLGNFIRRQVGDPAEAEDILQDVFQGFVQAYRLPAPIEQATAWLFRVARNRIINRYRKKKEQALSETGDEPDATDETYQLDLALPSPDAGPAAAYARSILLDTLRQALDALPANQREVFVAHELEGIGFKEMAAQTGVSINTLLGRKRYAVLFLRSRLQEAYDALDL
jgi:RNA polymerase sigma factor (sigma-70 family)